MKPLPELSDTKMTEKEPVEISQQQKFTKSQARSQLPHQRVRNAT